MPVTFTYVVGREAPDLVFHLALAGSALVAVSVVTYCRRQVRSGRWSHVDASASHERRQINLFLMTLFFGIAALMGASGQSGPIISAPALSGALVGLGHLLRPWLHLSLHSSFALFSALLVWPDRMGVAALLLLAGGVAWSRLALARHTPKEVAIGALAGAAAGVVFHLAA